MPERRFVDANIFINWLKARPATALENESVAISGYILRRMESGEEALTTITVKDEVSIWLSRYRVEALNRFMELLSGYTTLEIVAPTTEDQIEAGRLMESHDLGYTDLLSLVTMKRLGIQEIYSSDTGFDTIPNIRRIFSELTDEDGYKDFIHKLEDFTRNYSHMP